MTNYVAVTAVANANTKTIQHHDALGATRRPGSHAHTDKQRQLPSASAGHNSTHKAKPKRDASPQRHVQTWFLTQCADSKLAAQSTNVQPLAKVQYQPKDARNRCCCVDVGVRCSTHEPSCGDDA